MTEYLELKAIDCKHCYKCIRNCPVKAIRYSGNQATIMQDECVLCGRCFVSCPQNAKQIRNDLWQAQQLIASGADVYVSLAPSFIANYPGATIEAMRSALAKLGFADTLETAMGATLVKQYYDSMVNSGEQTVLISTCCHTVNTLVEKHYPGILPLMAPVVSPMQAHAKSIQNEHSGAKIVFIGPCISKKAEAEQYPGTVDCVLTFEELDSWLVQKNISIVTNPNACPKDLEGKARLFPITGGILRTMQKENPDYNYIAIDGMEDCIAALEDIATGNLQNCFIEMSACSGSCIGGPAMSHNPGLIRGTSYVNQYSPHEDFIVESLPTRQMEKHLHFNAQPRMKFSDNAIAEVLRKIGKVKLEDELNCGSCGYDTCREKATAVLSGKANLEMCLPHLMNKAQSFSDTIIKSMPSGVIVLNADLEVQQINQSACTILNVKHEEDVLNRNVVCLMDPTLFLEVLDGKDAVYDNLLYLAEYGRYIRLSVIQDKDYGIIMGIMKDITKTETARAARREMADKTIYVTDKVIEKQMRTVQEIASLLGETAAETKIALTKLKETLRDD